MEQSALRPKPMPGQEPGGGTGRPAGSVRRPHAVRRGGRRLTTLLLGLFAGTALLLSGVGLGTVGATVIGVRTLAELQQRPGQTGQTGQSDQADQADRAGQSGQTGQRGEPGRPVRPGTRSAPARPGASASPAPAPSPARAILGLEVVDAGTSGAQVVGVHMPGPGYAAGLVRGDVLLTFDGIRVDSAADLVEAVHRARPGERVTLTVRHRGGGHRRLTIVPGVLT
ncbi:PDZ domain-containing protein [Streptomyces sp. JB150]|uniref:PDZ domain-containing protein n=1 Tax=Streptomyces sp. JB150 TaxID=2714844 RepID=UPI0014074FDC|nr:PDZ domain-containing protein [Streptomyces sp. JB150]QIJ65347.1 PDZ domain-containing protein [Streptomyces sp. JB150]